MSSHVDSAKGGWFGVGFSVGLLVIGVSWGLGLVEWGVGSGAIEVPATLRSKSNSASCVSASCVSAQGLFSAVLSCRRVDILRAAVALL